MLTVYKRLIILITPLTLLIGGDAVEWGYLDSLKGKYYLKDKLYSGPVIKQLDVGLMTGQFHKGMRHGLWQTLNKIGEPIMIGHFNMGKKHGKFEQWYDDGEKRHKELIASFDQNRYVDLYKEWYPNGRRSIIGFYINGKEQGKYQEWYENGKKALKAKFINGIPEGMYREWHENGKKSLKVRYENGKANGTWTQWYENGKKQMQIEYVNGIPRGRAIFWFPDGSLRGEGIIKSEIQGGGWILEDAGGNKQVFK